MKEIKLGDRSFIYSSSTEFVSKTEDIGFIVDLPNLESINLGYAALDGVNEDNCSLCMRGRFVASLERQICPN